MKVYVHIGMEKTGSTSIERTCARNQRAMAAQGVRYLPRPRIGGRRFAANHALAKAIAGRYDRVNAEGVLHGTRDFVSRADESVLISSELFAKFDASQVARLAEVLGGRDVEIIVYLRNQIDWVEAMLKQKVMSSQAVKLSKWFDEYLPRADYLAMCDRWARVFGEAAVHARCYDGKADILADFFSVVGIHDRSRIVTPARPINPSLAAPTYDMKRAANAFGNSRAFRVALTRMQVAAGWQEKPRVLSARQDRKVREIAEATNPALWARYIRDGSEPFCLPESTPVPAAAIQDEALAAVVAGIWLEQSQTIADLKARVKALERRSWWRSWWRAWWR